MCFAHVLHLIDMANSSKNKTGGWSEEGASKAIILAGAGFGVAASSETGCVSKAMVAVVAAEEKVVEVDMEVALRSIRGSLTICIKLSCST